MSDSPSLPIPTVIQAIVDRSLASVSNLLVKAIDDQELRGVCPWVSPILRSIPVKKLKTEAKQIKKAGNQQQFDHTVKVLQKFQSVFHALAQSKIHKAKDALKEGMDLVLHRVNLIGIAGRRSTRTRRTSLPLSRKTIGIYMVQKKEQRRSRKTEKRKGLCHLGVSQRRPALQRHVLKPERTKRNERNKIAKTRKAITFF